MIWIKPNLSMLKNNQEIEQTRNMWECCNVHCELHTCFLCVFCLCVGKTKLDLLVVLMLYLCVCVNSLMFTPPQIELSELTVAWTRPVAAVLCHCRPVRNKLPVFYFEIAVEELELNCLFSSSVRRRKMMRKNMRRRRRRRKRIRRASRDRRGSET